MKTAAAKLLVGGIVLFGMAFGVADNVVAGDGGLSGSKIAWTGDLADGFKTAARLKKPLMVDFYAPWCRWCKKLDAEVFTDPAIVREAAGFIAVKADIGQYKKEAARYGIRVVPTVVFFNSDGSEKTRISKCPPSAKFLEVMSRAARE